MSYEFEKKKLYSLLGDNLVRELKRQPIYIAGGTITSLFCNREVNDIDVYFKSEEAFVDFVSSIWGDGRIVASTSKASLVLLRHGKEIQMIHFMYFPKAEDIFDTFDFTVCMGAFDFETEEFKLHPNFFQHNSQRILKFNKNTAFPIVSLMRVQKYKDKGYSISKPEYIRIALSCMDLDINTYEELKEQMGGMYGVNYDKLFKDKEGTVDLQEAIDVIADLVLDDDYFAAPEEIGSDMGDLDEFLESITTVEIPYTTHKGRFYRIRKGVLVRCTKKPNRGAYTPIEEVLKDKKYYKFVEKRGDKYYSFFDRTFEYIIDKEAVAKGYSANLYFNDLTDISHSSYADESKKVLIEAEFNIEDFVEVCSNHHVQLKKCKVLREVPVEEWKKYIKDEDDIPIE